MHDISQKEFNNIMVEQLFTTSDIIQLIEMVGILSGILAIYLEYRKTRSERGYDTYLQTALAYIELERYMGENKEIQEIFAYDPKYKALSPEDRMRYDYCTMVLMVFEIIYLAHIKGWLEKDEWEGWGELIKELIKESKYFRETWKNEGYLYAKKFRDFINSIITS